MIAMAPVSSALTIKRCVVLAGGLKASPLQSLCPISVLDLDLEHELSVAGAILARVRELAPQEIPVQVVFGTPVPAPRAPTSENHVAVTIVPEPLRWRGPAGLVRDICHDLSGDDQILVLEGSRSYASPLGPLVAAHARSGADVTIARAPDHTPGGAYVMCRRALDDVPSMGFLDLKEQLFSRLLKAGRRLVVETWADPGAPPLRTFADYLGEVSRRVARGSGEGRWKLVSSRAQVDGSAFIDSSVIMEGSCVEPGSLVARSLVLPGSVVPAGAEIVDSVVHPRGVRKTPGAFTTLHVNGDEP